VCVCVRAHTSVCMCRVLMHVWYEYVSTGDCGGSGCYLTHSSVSATDVPGLQSPSHLLATPLACGSVISLSKIFLLLVYNIFVKFVIYHRAADV